MPDVSADLRSWHDWTDPDFFSEERRRESRFLPLFLRQILPFKGHETKLTITGWMLIIVSMGIGSAAYNTASNILFMTLSLLLSSLVLSGILSFINFRRVRWSLVAPTHLQAGEVGMTEIDVVNKKSFFPSMALCFRISHSQADGPERLYLQHSLAAGGTIKLEWTFTPERRGRCFVRLRGVESQFPFGFLRKTLIATVEEAVLVWPRRIAYSFAPGAGGRRFLSGNARKKAGQGNDLLNLRAYERGDPPRMVHWKATARAGKLVVRQLAQEGESGFHIYLDPDAQHWQGERFENLCSVVCALADDLFQLGRLETVTIAGESPESMQHIRDVHDFFDRLAVLKPFVRGDDAPPSMGANWITFRPEGEDGVGIFVGENRAGQTNP